MFLIFELFKIEFYPLNVAYLKVHQNQKTSYMIELLYIVIKFQ